MITYKIYVENTLGRPYVEPIVECLNVHNYESALSWIEFFKSLPSTRPLYLVRIKEHIYA